MTPRLRAWPYLLSTVVLLAILVGVYLFFVRTYTGQIVDQRAFNGAGVERNGLVVLAERFLDFVPVIGLGLGLLLTLLIGLAGRRYRQLLVAFVVVGLACVVAELSKYVFLTRPATGATDPLGNSFPSGHATLAAAGAFAVFLVAAPRWRRLAAVVGGAFATLTGVLALISQWHRPSDVVAGFMLVAACGCLGGAALVLMRVPVAARPAGSLALLWWLAGASALVSLVAFALIYATVNDHGQHLQIAYLGGGTGILAVGSALTAAGNRLFRAVG